MKIKYLQYHPDSPDCISTIIMEDNLPAPIVESPIIQIVIDAEEDLRGKMIDHEKGKIIEYDESKVDMRERDNIDDGSSRYTERR